ncbi:oxysterol-binding protein-related protein 5 isoform X3 [Antechinus flavipes]|nr:oxysterol-binding protein-related protein 5 isoform X3 [Antechinus flavipes]XP_051820793.1 oxysterol-binding protein-related protein 5 isoform X3 [Antechinus flavipes]XP_051820794.1 oxysterol-binding protein-related protein 5 isoform X3 [Antechinus flavipes]
MKEENFLRRRFSLCPPSSTPQKIDPRKLTRNLFFSGDHEIYPLSPGKDMESTNGVPLLKDEVPPTPVSVTRTLQNNDYRLCNGSDRESLSPTAKVTKKETLKVQKRNYRQEKKRATQQLFSALKDPSVVIMADWLKIRGTLKGWTKLWCILKPGVLLVYKTPKVGQWVGTILLHSCELIERPSKKDGFCFKLFHPLDQSIWAMKGPKGENVGSITQPLPSSYLIFRAPSESDGRCWLDALELALRCSSLFRLSTSKPGKDGELTSQPDSSPVPLDGLLHAGTISDQDLFHLHQLLWMVPSEQTASPGLPLCSRLTEASLENHQLENDAFSDRSEKDTIEGSENETRENSRKTNDSESDQSETPGELGQEKKGTTYIEQIYEEFGETGESSQTETVSEENKSLIWILLKQLRPGMDLSRVVLPTFILEPRSFLNKLSDYYYHADLLSQAVLEEDPLTRMKQVVRWYLSGFYKKPKGIKKPYNPILGETFRCCWYHPQTNSHTFYISEQVSHHPPVSAFHVSNRKDGFCITGSILAKSKFYGNSLSALLDGKATLTFLSRGEDYIITMPYAHCKGILYGTMTMELGGKVTIECEKNNYQAELEFKLKPFFGGNSGLNQISGKIKSGEDVLASLDGHWDREVYISDPKNGASDVFWNPTADIRRQRLKRHIVLFEEQTELESERLWQHVTSAINKGDQVKATQEKFVLEEEQRRRARERQEALLDWKPLLFLLDPSSQEWHYKYEDLRPWDPLTDIAQFEQDGRLQTMGRRAPLRLTARNQVARHKRTGKECRLRKASDQPSNHSQNTESSCSTPESVQDLSDEERDADCESSCARCGKENQHLKEIHTAVLSLQKAQQDIHRNLTALNKKSLYRRAPGSFLHSSRCWFLLCVFLTCQLFINYVLK